MTTQNIFNLTDQWNNVATTFTAIKMNVTDTASAAGSLLLDLQVGGSSKFSVSKGGRAEIAAISLSGTFGGDGNWWSTNNLNVASGSVLSFGAADLVLRRDAAASLCLGNADAAAPVAQTLGVQSVVAGTTNTAGAAFTIAGSKGTGTGNGGNVALKWAPPGSTGSTQNSLVDGLILIGSAAAANARIGIGGTTSSFPGLKRIGAELHARLADDSAYCQLYASLIVGDSTVFAAFNSAIPAGGSATVAFKATSTANFGVFFGSGAPTISAAKGSLYLRSDGTTTNDRMYVNTNGSTTWTAVVTAA